MDKAITSIPFWLRGLVVTLVLSLALGWMAYQRISLLKNGFEVVIETRPVDPRSLFRGHYARLDYNISSIAKGKFDDGQLKWKRGNQIFVTLKKGEGVFWVPVGIAKTYPVVRGHDIVIAGRIKNTYGKQLRVRYGIEKYFAAKKDALKLERIDRRKTAVGVILRVSKTGEAAISGVMIGGKKIYDEPLY